MGALRASCQLRFLPTRVQENNQTPSGGIQERLQDRINEIYVDKLDFVNETTSSKKCQTSGAPSKNTACVRPNGHCQTNLARHF